MYRIVHSIAAVVLLASALAMPASAQGTAAASDHPARGQTAYGSIVMAQQTTGTSSGKPRPPTEATDAYREAATQQQVDMDIRFTHDTDQDFAALLAAQSKGAAAIARIELRHGKDPEMRRLAEQVLAAAEKDAAQAKAWRGKNP